MSKRVLRAESFYLPPPSLKIDAWDRVPQAERAFRWLEHAAQRRVPPPDGVLAGQRVYAHINHNRWIADCRCGSAQVVSPTDPRFACTECGWGWVIVVFPRDADKAEKEVERLLPHERNWRHPEDPKHPGRPDDPGPPDAPADPVGPSRKV